MTRFQALMAEQGADKQIAVSLRECSLDDLPAGDVLVRVEYSGINYKDALAVSGRGKILRSLPMIPGVDLAGEVVQSEHPGYRPGDRVVLTGWGVGEHHSGGFAGYARLRGEWLVPLPAGLDARSAMALGTAGLTAMLCVDALEQHGLTPDSGMVVVTGATGGVGSVAVALLARLGYQVAAVSGKLAEQGAYLTSLGAGTLIDRAELAQPARPLESESYAGAIDTAGGEVLAGLLPRIRYGGTVAACGLAAGHALNTTVMPFILRGVTLAGVDSVMCPLARRQAAWQRLAELMPRPLLDSLTHEVDLAGVAAVCEQMMVGRTHGRHVVRLGASAAG